MLMGSGVTNGMLFYSVFEPIYHYTSRNKYSADPTLPDNELAQTSLLLSMYHIGMNVVFWGNLNILVDKNDEIQNNP